LPLPSRRPGALSTSAVAASALIAGAGSYILLILVAKNVSATGYADFAAFWSIAVTVGLGVYFPVEQETARDFSGRPAAPRSGLRRISFGFAAVITVVLLVASICLAFVPQAVAFVGSPALLGSLGIAVLGYLVQFPTRGLLSGAHRTSSYAATIGTEGVLRIVLPAAVALSGGTEPALYALTVGVAAALSVVPAVIAKDRAWLRTPDARFGLFSSRAARLIVAALTIQLLLNSGVLIARSLDAQDQALAGQILTCLSIARIPVFAYQAGQVLYMPRVAAAWKAGDVGQVRRIVAATTLGVAGVGVIAVVGMALLGPWVIGLFFSPELVLPTGPLIVLTAGVSLFLLAQVLSDATLATGGHSVLLTGWIAGLAAAVVTLLLVGDPVYRAVLPLGVGSVVASAIFTTALLSRVRPGVPHPLERHL